MTAYTTEFSELFIKPQHFDPSVYPQLMDSLFVLAKTDISDNPQIPKANWLKATEIMPTDEILSAEIHSRLFDPLELMYQLATSCLDQIEHQHIDDFRTRFINLLGELEYGGNMLALSCVDNPSTLQTLIFWLMFMSVKEDIKVKIFNIQSGIGFDDDLLIRMDTKHRNILRYSINFPDIAKSLVAIIGKERYTDLLKLKFNNEYTYIELLAGTFHLSEYIKDGLLDIERLVDIRFSHGMNLLHLIVLEEQLQIAYNKFTTFISVYNDDDFNTDDTAPMHLLNGQDDLKNIIVSFFGLIPDANNIIPYEMYFIAYKNNISAIQAISTKEMIFKFSGVFTNPNVCALMIIKMLSNGELTKQHIMENMIDFIGILIKSDYIYDWAADEIETLFDEDTMKQTFTVNNMELPITSFLMHTSYYVKILTEPKLRDLYISQLNTSPKYMNVILPEESVKFGNFKCIRDIFTKVDNIEVFNIFAQNLSNSFSFSSLYIEEGEIEEGEIEAYYAICRIFYDAYCNNVHQPDTNDDIVYHAYFYLMLLSCPDTADKFINTIDPSIINKIIHFFAEPWNCNGYCRATLESTIPIIVSSVVKIIKKHPKSLSELRTNDLIVFLKALDNDEDITYIIANTPIEILYGFHNDTINLSSVMNYDSNLIEKITNINPLTDRPDITELALQDFHRHCVISMYDHEHIILVLKSMYKVTTKIFYDNIDAIIQSLTSKSPYLGMLLTKFKPEEYQFTDEQVAKIKDHLLTSLERPYVIAQFPLITPHVLGPNYISVLSKLFVGVDPARSLLHELYECNKISLETLIHPDMVIKIIRFEVAYFDRFLAIPEFYNAVLLVKTHPLFQPAYKNLCHMIRNNIYTDEDMRMIDEDGKTLLVRIKETYGMKEDFPLLLVDIVTKFKYEAYRELSRLIISKCLLGLIVDKIDILDVISKYENLNNFVWSCVQYNDFKYIIHIINRLIDQKDPHSLEIATKIAIMNYRNNSVDGEKVLTRIRRDDKDLYFKIIFSLEKTDELLEIINSAILEENITIDIVIEAYTKGYIDLTDKVFDRYPQLIFLSSIVVTDSQVDRLIELSMNDSSVFNKLVTGTHRGDRALNIVRMMLARYIETDFMLFAEAINHITIDLSFMKIDKDNLRKMICNYPLSIVNLLKGGIFDIMDVINMFDRQGNYTVSYIDDYDTIKQVLSKISLTELKVKNNMNDSRLISFLSTNSGYKVVKENYELEDLADITDRNGDSIYQYMAMRSDFENIPEEAYTYKDNRGRNIVMKMCETDVQSDIISKAIDILIHNDAIMDCDNNGLTILHYIVRYVPTLLSKILQKSPKQLMMVINGDNETLLMYAIRYSKESIDILLTSEGITDYHSYTALNTGSILTYAIKYAPEYIDKLITWPQYHNQSLYVKDMLYEHINPDEDNQQRNRCSVNVIQLASVLNPDALRRLLKCNQRIISALLYEEIMINSSKFNAMKFAIFNNPDSVSTILNSDLCTPEYVKRSIELIEDLVLIVDCQPGSWVYLQENSKSEKYALLAETDVHYYGFNYRRMYSKNQIKSITHYIQHKQELAHSHNEQCSVCTYYKKKVIFTKCKHTFCAVCSVRLNDCPLCHTPSRQEEKIVIV